MSARVGSVIGVAFAVSCGGEAVDPRQPVSFVMGQVRESSANAIALAAEAWNLEFGTRIDIDGDADQKVPIRLTNEGCFNDLGFPTLGRTRPNDRDMFICPKIEDRPALLFDTLRHEMGHVLGIRAHSTERQSVMSRLSSGTHRFKEVDRYWFFNFNKDYMPPTGCHLTPRIAEGEPTALASPTDERSQLVWAEEGAIRFAALSATDGLMGIEPGAITTTGTAAALRAHATHDGMLLSWMEGTNLFLASVGADGQAERRSSVELQWPKESLYEISALRSEQSYYYAVTVRDGVTNAARTLHVLQIDQDTGAIQASTTLPRAYGQLVESGDQAYLVTAQIDVMNRKQSVEIGRLEASSGQLRIVDSSLLDEVDVAIVDGWAVPEPVLTVLPSSTGIIVMLDTSMVDDAITLIRMNTSAPLSTQRRTLIAAERVVDPTILEVGGDLFLAVVMQRSDHYRPEVYLARLDAETLVVEHPWERLSAADTVAAEHPRLALADGHLVAVWSEAHDIRTRCVELP